MTHDPASGNSKHRDVDSDPTLDEGGGPHDGSIWRKTERDHSLASLIELNNELAGATDIFETARLLLLTLMGQLGTSKAMIWMQSEAEPMPPVLLRSHGTPKHLARAVMAASTLSLWKRFCESPPPVHAKDVGESVGYATSTLVREAGLVLFASARAKGRFMLIAGFGPPFGGRRYGRVELNVLQASMAFAGVVFAHMDGDNWRIDANRRLREANGELRQLEQFNARAMTQVANALQTPLTVLQGCLEQMRERADRTDRGALEVSLAALRNMGTIINRLLLPGDPSQIWEAAEIADADVRHELESFCQDRRPSASCARCELVVEAPEALPNVRADVHRLSHILNGVLDELLRMARVGTQVRLRVTNDADATAPSVRIAFELGEYRPPPSSRDEEDAFAPPFVWDPARRAEMDLLRRLADEMGARLELPDAPGETHFPSLVLPAAVVSRKAA